MWVRSEYAGELAVLMTWLSALAPWAVTWISDLPGIFFWFHPVNLLFTPGVDLPGDRPLWVWEFLGFAVYSGETFVTYFWLAGSAIVCVALVYSLVYYLKTERVESLGYDPVRVLGVLLLGSGLLLTAAFVILFQNHAGTTVPVGATFQIVFGIILLKTERIEPAE